jgi:hypothetical protein
MVYYIELIDPLTDKILRYSSVMEAINECERNKFLTVFVVKKSGYGDKYKFTRISDDKWKQKYPESETIWSIYDLMMNFD